MFEEALRQYGYVVLFVGSIVEGDGTLAVAAFLAHRGYFALLPVLTVAAVASTLANEGLYRAARLRGRAAFEDRIATQPRYARVRTWVARRSGLLLFLSRFLWGFRIVVPAACGIVGMPARRFFLVNVTGAVIWAAVVGLLGYGCGQVLPQLGAIFHRYEGAVVMTLLLVAGSSALLWHRCDVRGLWKALVRPEQFGLEAADELTEAARSGRTGFWSRLERACEVQEKETAGSSLP